MTETASRSLFQAFPALLGRLPFVPLADLPTPLEPMTRLSAEIGADVWIKRDGLTHPVYGGNKIRKFEFVFGDALQKKAQAVLTGGGLGSHHNLAAAVIARQLGMQAICAYYCQPISAEVHDNLRCSVPLGIDAHFCGDYAGLAVSLVWQLIAWTFRTHRLPYFVYPGAPGNLGTLGYVNAAFEIRDQLDQMGVTQPKAVFVAVGSCGTFAGLLLGARLAGLRSRIVGVQVIEEDVANRSKIAKMVSRTARFLSRWDPSIPRIEVDANEIELLGGYLGPGYAHSTPEASQAVELLQRTECLPLETTYTGKTMAALLDHTRQMSGERLLFLDTYAEAPMLPKGDYQSLPKKFWPIFDPAHKVDCWCLRSRRDPGFCWKRSRV